MSDAVDTQAISQKFVEARLNNIGLSNYPGNIPKTLKEAYDIQAESIKNWDDKIVGWKVGGVPPALQEEFKAERLVGPIFERSVKYSEDNGHSPMPIFEEGFAAIEAEFVVQLGDVSSLPSTDLTLEQVKSAVSKVFIGVEIASSPLQVINDIGPVGPVSDFGNNNGLIVGPEVAEWADGDLSKYEVSVDINDESMGTVTCPPELKGPLGATKFLIEHLKQNGYDIPKGTYVSTGAITGVHQAFKDAKSVIKFEGLGTMTLELTPGGLK